MQARLDPFSFLVVSVAGWLNQRQQPVIQYLAEENRVLREHIGAFSRTHARVRALEERTSEEMTREWRGWSGAKEWASVEGELKLSCTAAVRVM
jgi:hypothetical protein